MLSTLNFPVAFPDTPVASIRLEIPREDISTLMDPAISELVAALVDQGIQPAGDLISYHHRRPTHSFDCEIAIPINTTLQDVGRVRNSVLPAASFISAEYVGPYEGLHSAWQEFLLAIAGSGQITTEIFFERYHKENLSHADPATYRTTLYKQLA
jgi:effector-binding domain-containing protein